MSLSNRYSQSTFTTMNNRAVLLLSLHLLLFSCETIRVSAFSQHGLASSRKGASLSPSLFQRRSPTTTTPASPTNKRMSHRRPRNHSSVQSASQFVADVETASETVLASSTSSQNLGRSLLQALGLGASDDELTLRQRIGKMGVCAAMAYSVISQINSGTTVSVSWFMYASRVSRSKVKKRSTC